MRHSEGRICKNCILERFPGIDTFVCRANHEIGQKQTVEQAATTAQQKFVKEGSVEQ
jgi:hypothetical protein